MKIISVLAALAALPSAASGAASEPTYTHDVKVFHEVTGKRSRPLPAQVALLVGGKAEGKRIPGLKGKHFVISDVKGGKIALTRHTGPDARLSLDVGPTCRANQQARYFIRASAVIGGKLRKAYSQGDCGWVVEVLDRDSQAVTHTTFIFEN